MAPEGVTLVLWPPALLWLLPAVFPVNSVKASLNSAICSAVNVSAMKSRGKHWIYHGSATMFLKRCYLGNFLEKVHVFYGYDVIAGSPSSFRPWRRRSTEGVTYWHGPR